ncbi:N,N'-diacetylbacillosaminyl-diphospho-undecaprenol alpha-1,3-N-acetylgalactosaminyltransferase [subsurface metagenome]
MKKRIVLIANTVWNIVNFRDNLIRSLKDADYDVLVFAPKDNDLRRLNTEFFHIPVYAKSMNPLVDILLIVRLVILLHKTTPDVVLNFTIKPVIYGTISARILGIPCVNNITGLGALFLRGAWSRMLGFMLYNIVMRITNIAFFQNPDDFRLFDRLGLLGRTGVDILPGSGVDLARFTPAKETLKRNADTVFLFVGRLLLEKGIEDYIDAARIVRETWKQVRFQVIGPFDSTGNESALRSKIMLAIKDGAILYSEAVEDVRPHLAKADCVVLPSYYREGTPRSLLEAAAMEKPIITTDMPGCREVVEKGKNGYLCRVKDPEDLARKMIQVIGLPTNERFRMGRYGRRKMERQFDESIVIGKYLSAIKDILGR